MKFLDPEWLISTFGLLGILGIVFAESGLLIGFFLPGDSLLFTAGLLVADGRYLTPLWLVCLLCVAAVAGDQFGYSFGQRVGPGAVPPAGLAAVQAGEPAGRRTSSRSTGAGRSCWPASCRSCGRSPRSWPARRHALPGFVHLQRHRRRRWGDGVTVLGYFLGQIAFVQVQHRAHPRRHRRHLGGADGHRTAARPVALPDGPGLSRVGAGSGPDRSVTAPGCRRGRGAPRRRR